jgi:metallo-beta-lactamase family protein
MKITFCGAARLVTGSCYLLEYQGTKFLVDCGMFQGNKAIKENNYGEFPFNPAEISFVVLTHAHIDHSGLLPKLCRLGYKNEIYATSATVALAAIMLPDSGYIQEMEVERKNKRLSRAGQKLLEPIYTAEQAMDMQKQFVAKDYGVTFSPINGVEVTLRDAGHILGSAMAEINFTENGVSNKLVFSGDLGRNGRVIIQDPYIVDKCDFLVMESTYGDRLHSGGFEEEKAPLANIISATMARGGNVIIPAFAVDRTQDVLMMLHELQEEQMISKYPIYVDSPLAIKATEIFAASSSYFDDESLAMLHKDGKAPFLLDNLTYVHTAEESMRLNNLKHGAIIISASGMADAGRIKHHLKHNLWRQECSVVFFGFQAEGTLGRRLTEGATKVTIHGEVIDVKASIYNMEGFSAHADYEDILAWLGRCKTLPGQIFLTHGEETSALSLAQKIYDKYQLQAIVPHFGDVVELKKEGMQITDHQDIAKTIIDKNLLVDINTVLQQITASQDIDKLIRIRDFLKQIS